MGWLVSLVGLPRLIGGGLLALVIWFAYDAVHTVIDNYTAMGAKIERLEHTNSLLTSRLDSYNLRIARRDEAIAASKCRATIQDWIKNPDKIPHKSDPFAAQGGG